MRLTVIDPTLRDRAGHNFDYARQVCADARAAGFDVRIVTHAQFDVNDEALGLAVTPWFKSGLKDAPRQGLGSRLRGVLAEEAIHTLAQLKQKFAPPPADADEHALVARASEFSRQLKALLPTLGLGTTDRVFFPTLSWADAIEAARTSQPGYETLIMLRFDPPAADWSQAQLRAAAVEAGDRVRWISDTHQLADAFKAMLGATVGVAPIPIDTAALKAAAAARPRPPPVRVVFLGESRIEKGATLLPEIIRLVLGHKDSTDVAFVIQQLANVEGGERGVAATFAELDKLEGPRVEIVRGELSCAAFHHIIGRGHILLAPYQAPAYRLRSSGLIVQALAAGLAIVAPAQKSWIAKTLTEESAASFCYLGGEADIATAIVRAASHIRASAILPRVPAVSQVEPPWVAGISH